MAKTLRTLIFLFLCLGALPLKAQWDYSFNGYVKALGTFNHLNKDPYPAFLQSQIPGSYEDYQIHNRFNFDLYYGSQWHANAGMRNRLFYGYTYNRTPTQITDLQNDPSTLMDLSFMWTNSNSALSVLFDRAWLEYDNQRIRARVGRQRINWGINTVWNPNDIFNQYNYFDFDYEERPGVDAVDFQWYFTPRSSIELAYSPNLDDPIKSIGGLLYKTNIKGYDVQLLQGYFKGDYVAGAGWAGSFGNVGFKGEASAFVPMDDLDTTSRENFVLSTGFDYSLPNGLYMQISYLYNQLGNSNSSILGSGLLANQTLTAKNLFPYQHTTFVGFNFAVTPLLTADLSTMTTLDFNNFFLIPSLSYSIAENLDLLLLAQVFWGVPPTQTDSYFLGSSIFTRLKYSF